MFLTYTDTFMQQLKKAGTYQIMQSANCNLQATSWVLVALSTTVRKGALANLLPSNECFASWVDSCFDNIITEFMINNKTDAWKMDVNLLNKRPEVYIIGRRLDPSTHYGESTKIKLHL